MSQSAGVDLFHKQSFYISRSTKNSNYTWIPSKPVKLIERTDHTHETPTKQTGQTFDRTGQTTCCHNSPNLAALQSFADDPPSTVSPSVWRTHSTPRGDSTPSSWRPPAARRASPSPPQPSFLCYFSRAAARRTTPPATTTRGPRGRPAAPTSSSW